MLEKPSLADERILSALRGEFGLEASELTFLPLGADVNTAVYRVRATGGEVFFLKLRKAGFREIQAALPRFLHERGIGAVIPPLPARSGQAWAGLDEYRLILAPYIEGQNGYEAHLSPTQWRAFGAALRTVHAVRLPAELADRLPREDWSPAGREQALDFLAQARERDFADPAARKTAALLRERQAVIRRLVSLGEELAARLRARSLEPILCHGDLHAGNLHLTPAGELYLVDWDDAVLAPRERDLALIGGCPAWSASADAAAFYQGYGGPAPDREALAYFRCEREVQDIAAFCRELLLSEASGADREQSYQYLAGQFLPGGEVELALGTIAC